MQLTKLNRTNQIEHGTLIPYKNQSIKQNTKLDNETKQNYNAILNINMNTTSAYKAKMS